MAALVAAMTFLAQRNLKFDEIALKREVVGAFRFRRS
jgi:hypothetical protein